MKRWLSHALLFSLLAAPVVAQTPNPVGSAKQTPSGQGPEPIKVKVELVNVLMTVTDKKNRLVINLTKDDFRVLENGQSQSIRFFSRESNLPLRIGVLIDTSNSIRERLRFEEEAAVDFLNTALHPGKDQAFVLAFDVESQIVQDYTDDIDKLATAIRSLQAGGGTGLYDAIYLSCKDRMQFLPPPEPYLRRVLVVLSDGLDNQTDHTREEALAMAQRGEVIIVAISTNRSGLTRRGDQVLKYLAEQTCGRAFFPF